MKIHLPWLLSLSLLLACNPLYAAVQRAKFTAGNQYLVVESLGDVLVGEAFIGTAASGWAMPSCRSRWQTI